MILQDETYISAREFNCGRYKITQSIKVIVEKSIVPGMDRIKRVVLSHLKDDLTNKEDYSDYLRWAADEIDKIPYNRQGEPDESVHS